MKHDLDLVELRADRLTPEFFDTLTREDFENRAFLDEIRQALSERLALIDRCEAAEREARLVDGCKHPGYVIGQHWLAAAYERICVGDAEVATMGDYSYVPAVRIAELEAANAELEKRVHIALGLADMSVPEAAKRAIATACKYHEENAELRAEGELAETQVDSMVAYLEVEPLSDLNGKLSQVSNGLTLIPELRAEVERQSRDIDGWVKRGADLEHERDGFKSHRDGLYRVFGWLARDERKHLSMVDEMIQADVDSIMAERDELRAKFQGVASLAAEDGWVKSEGTLTAWLDALLTAHRGVLAERDDLRADRTKAEDDLAAVIDELDALRERLDLFMPLYEELKGCRWIREDGQENKLAVAMANLEQSMSESER